MLQEFNIDSRGCVAKQICSTLYQVDEDSFFTQTIAKSAYRYFKIVISKYLILGISENCFQ
jgi:hypothetical protein